ncbi:hypothetical protein ACI2JA_03765 [Alkalihalobacillus sp. NPDC078783]
MTSKDKDYEAVGQLRIDFRKGIRATSESEAWMKVIKDMVSVGIDPVEVTVKMSDGQVITITTKEILDYVFEMNDELQEK